MCIRDSDSASRIAAVARGGVDVDEAAQLAILGPEVELQRRAEQIASLEERLRVSNELKRRAAARIAALDAKLSRASENGANLEHVKHVIYKLLLVGDEGVEPLLPVISHFFRFSKEELRAISDARRARGSWLALPG